MRKIDHKASEEEVEVEEVEAVEDSEVEEETSMIMIIWKEADTEVEAKVEDVAVVLEVIEEATEEEVM